MALCKVSAGTVIERELDSRMMAASALPFSYLSGSSFTQCVVVCSPPPPNPEGIYGGFRQKEATQLKFATKQHRVK